MAFAVMKRRLDALETGGGFWTTGELIDNLDGVPLPDGKMINPAIAKALSCEA